MRNLISFCSSALTICIVIFSTEASAQTLIDATDPDEIRNLASGYGSASLTTANDGSPMVSGRIDGIGYSIYFYGCEDAKDCRSIQFSAQWTGFDNLSTEVISEWNRTKRFGGAHLDLNSNPVIEWDVNLYAGVSRNNLDDTIDWWSIVLKNFEAFLVEQ